MSLSRSIAGKPMIYCFVCRTQNSIQWIGRLFSFSSFLIVFATTLLSLLLASGQVSFTLYLFGTNTIFKEKNNLLFHKIVYRFCFSPQLFKHCSNVRSELFNFLFSIQCVCDLADEMLRYIRCSHNIECANVICDFSWPTSATKTTTTATTIVVTYLIRKTKCLPLSMSSSYAEAVLHTLTQMPQI